MQGHGNLFWEIQFDLGPTKAAGYCERTHISVCGYDYKETYERAQKLYNLAHTAGQVVNSFSLMLRRDNSDKDEALHYNILTSWYLADADDPDAFFCGDPEVSMKALRMWRSL
ncbi:MAG: hypothetical protein HUK12_00940 [Muribaculaceae bacterium]|nr:hypothetical protein [Muribaculaceae bacterium]